MELTDYKQIRLLIGFQVVTTLIGICLLIAGIVILGQSGTLLYQVRHLTADSTQVPGLEITYSTPVAFGFLSVTPILILSAILNTPAKHYRKLSKVFVGIQIALIVIEFPLTVTPVILLNGITKQQYSTALMTSLDTYYLGLPYSHTQSHALSMMWDQTMLTQECCGVNGQLDFLANYGKYASLWYTSYRYYQLSNGTVYTGNSVQLPLACCALAPDSTLLTNQNWAETQFELLSESCPLSQLYTTNDKGCGTILYETLTTYTYAIFGCLMVLLFFQGFASGFALAAMSVISPDDIEANSMMNSNRSSPSNRVYPSNAYSRWQQAADSYKVNRPQPMERVVHDQMIKEMPYSSYRSGPERILNVQQRY